MKFGVEHKSSNNSKAECRHCRDFLVMSIKVFFSSSYSWSYHIKTFNNVPSELITNGTMEGGAQSTNTFHEILLNQ